MDNWILVNFKNYLFFVFCFLLFQIFFFVSAQWKSAWLSYEVSFISALGMVSSESWKRLYSNYYAQYCKLKYQLITIGTMQRLCIGCCIWISIHYRFHDYEMIFELCITTFHILELWKWSLCRMQKLIEPNSETVFDKTILKNKSCDQTSYLYFSRA